MAYVKHNGMTVRLRITKGMLTAARIELATINALADESHNGRVPCLKFHVVSANNHMATLQAGKEPLPAWIGRNRAHLLTLGWQCPEPLPGVYHTDESAGR